MQLDPGAAVGCCQRAGHLPDSHRLAAFRPAPQLDLDAVVGCYQRSRRRLLVLGYNATLTTAVEAPRQPKKHFDQIQVGAAFGCLVRAAALLCLRFPSRQHAEKHGTRVCWRGRLCLLRAGTEPQRGAGARRPRSPRRPPQALTRVNPAAYSCLAALAQNPLVDVVVRRLRAELGADRGLGLLRGSLRCCPAPAGAPSLAGSRATAPPCAVAGAASAALHTCARPALQVIGGGEKARLEGHSALQDSPHASQHTTPPGLPGRHAPQVISGGEKARLEEVFTDLGIWLAAENGAVIRPPGSKVRGCGGGGLGWSRSRGHRVRQAAAPPPGRPPGCEVRGVWPGWAAAAAARLAGRRGQPARARAGLCGEHRARVDGPYSIQSPPTRPPRPAGVAHAHGRGQRGVEGERAAGV